MMQEITQEMIQGLSDSQLALVTEWTANEKKARTERHKQQTLAKIRELARSIEVSVKIDGVRGRPVGSRKQNHMQLSMMPKKIIETTGTLR